MKINVNNPTSYSFHLPKATLKNLVCGRNTDSAKVKLRFRREVKASASKTRTGWHDPSWGQGEVERALFASIQSLPSCSRQRANPITVLWINVSTPGLSALQGHSTTQVNAGSQLKYLTWVLSETVLHAVKSQPMTFFSYLSRQCQSFGSFFMQSLLIYEELLL